MLSRLLPNIEESGNPIRMAWDRLHALPGGVRLFSRLVGAMAPYTGSIGARVVKLGPGRSQVELDDRRAVRNHLRSVHAVALANLAELTGNIAVAYGLADDARFIVAGMSIDYLKKARGTLTGICEVEVPASNAKREIDVPVTIFDAVGDPVAVASLRTLIGPKKSARAS
ncbi:MAG: hotdog fold domain-containing protein [Haliangiales bacterium]